MSIMRFTQALLLGLLLGCAPLRAADPEPPTIAFLGVWDRAKPLLERASRETGIPVAFPSLQEAIEGDALRAVDLIYVLNLKPLEANGLRDRVLVLRETRPDVRVVSLDSRDSQQPLKEAKLLIEDPRIPAYWRANGLVNIRRLLRYTAITWYQAAGDVEPPAVVPDAGFYLPNHEEAIADFSAFRQLAPWQEGRPVAVLAIQQSFWVTGDVRVIDAEIAALQDAGFNTVTIFGDRAGMVDQMIRDAAPAIIVEDRHGTIWDGGDGASLLEELDVPYLRPISMLSYTADEWRADPRGLHYVDVGLFLTIQESTGTIEPLVVGGLQESIHGFKLHAPIPDRIERFAARAAAWVNLRRKPVAEKTIAIIHYNKSAGKDDLMRGSPTGAFLDTPASLMRFLPRLAAAGYAVDDMPADLDALLDRLRERGQNLGPWAQGELEEMADLPGAVLIPQAQYEAWFTSHLSASRQAEMIEHYGPPPGKLMVVQRNGTPHIVIPAIRLGKVILAPQPLRGETQDESLLHSRDVPPPHNYLAFYWWLQESVHADALVHWGTHGTVELLPGKDAGLTGDDWGDICVGTMPVINPWIMDNLGESTLSRRRSYAVLVDHLAPPAVNAGLTDELHALHNDIDKFETLEPGLLREEFRRRITDGVVSTRVAETLKLDDLAERGLSDEEMDAVVEYLHALYNSTTPVSLHVLGLPPAEKYLAPYLVSILKRPFLERLASEYPVPDEVARLTGERDKYLRAKGEELMAASVLGDAPAPASLQEDVTTARDLLARLNQSDLEISNLLRALNGGYVPPGPGPEPIWNPASIPSGRNLYALNPEEIPTRASWEVAVKLVDQLLREKTTSKVGIDLNGMNTMRDFGVNEGQILYLMGVRPIWNSAGLAIDVELIPRAELGRPRVDVFIAMGGLYKENFPTRVALLDKAVRLASSAEEADNRVRLGTADTHARLLARGFSESRAEALAVARIFGTKPGNMSGTNILYLVPRSGVWDSDQEIASVYIDSMSYVYTGEIWGERVDGLYDESIQGVDTIVRTWTSNMTSQLSNHHAYEYLGGLSMAVTTLTGREPEALIADVRDPSGARMREFDEVLASTLRTELLNRKWIEGMQTHDYSGAGQMAELVRNTYGWDVTRSDAVSDAVWDDIYATYMTDKYALGLREWFERVNPHALQEMSATLLEASRKGYWQASDAQVAELSRLYADSLARFGDSAGLMSGGNSRLHDYVAEQLQAPGDQARLRAFQDAVAATAGETDEAPRVHGPVLESATAEEAASAQPAASLPVWSYLVIAAVVLLFLVGVWRKSGQPT